MTLKIDTKQVLLDSLEKLLEEKEFSQITVGDITRHAGSSRSVFYKYFHDKYELATWAIEQFCGSVVNEMKDSAEPIKNYTARTLTFLYNKKDFYRKVLKYKGQNSFNDIFVPLFMKTSSDYAKKSLNMDVLPEDVLFSIKFNGAAQGYIIQEWLENGCPETPEHLGKLICENSIISDDKIQIRFS